MKTFLIFILLGAIAPACILAGASALSDLRPSLRSLTDAEKLFQTRIAAYNVPTSGSDREVMLISNPADSGRNIYLWHILVSHLNGGDTDRIKWRLKMDPVITSSGSIKTNTLVNFGGTNTSKLIIGEGPTLSDDGETLDERTSTAANHKLYEFRGGLKLPPGERMLLWGDALVSATDVSITILWFEEDE